MNDPTENTPAPDAAKESEANNQPPKSSEQSASQADESKLADAGKAALTAEREARKTAERELKQVNARLKALEDKGKDQITLLTERVEAAEKRAAEAKTKWRDAAKTGAITRAATAANAIDNEAIIALINPLVSVEDDETIFGLDEALENLKTTKPHLFRKQTGLGQTDAAAQNKNDVPLNSDALLDALKAAVGLR